MRIGSLCSGYGGLDLALEAVTGATTAWVCEYDKHPSTILAERFPHAPNYGDITATDWATVEPVDWITAGYPCQPFSHAGKRQGTNDDRHIWPHVADAIRVLRPRDVLLENVAGHFSLGFGDVLGDLAALGYDARWGVLRAADVGAPHGRKRVFIVARDAERSRENPYTAPGGEWDPTRQPDRRTATDTENLGHERGGDTRGRRPGCVAVADAGGERHGRRQDSRTVGRLDGEDAGTPRQRQRPRTEPVHRSSETPTDTNLGGLESIRRVQPIRRDTHGRDSADIAWGAYEPAIRRWEHIIGRPAPAPTEPGRNGPRLAPAFVEWMMGLPAGWVTDIDIPRNAQLKALGNGVVPQQAAAALHWLTDEAVAA